LAASSTRQSSASGPVFMWPEVTITFRIPDPRARAEISYMYS